MRGITTVEGATTPGPAAPRRTAGALAAPLATTVAVVTVVASALVLARYDRPGRHRRRHRGWLSSSCGQAAVMVEGAWLVRATIPCSTGLAVATAGRSCRVGGVRCSRAGRAVSGGGPAHRRRLAQVPGLADGPACPPRRQAIYMLAAPPPAPFSAQPFAAPGCFRPARTSRHCSAAPTTRDALTITSLCHRRAAVATAALLPPGPLAHPAASRRPCPGAQRSPSLRPCGCAGGCLRSVSGAPEPFAVGSWRRVCAIGSDFADPSRLDRWRPAPTLRRCAVRGPSAGLFPFRTTGLVDAAGANTPPAPGSTSSVRASGRCSLLLVGAPDQGEVLAGLTPATRILARQLTPSPAPCGEVHPPQRLVATWDA